MFWYTSPDGAAEAVTANIIAENLYSQVDDEGNQFQMLDEILDHRCTDEALTADEAFITTPSGAKRRVWTAKGVEHLVSFKDGSANWVPLKDLKMSNPIEVAECAVSKGIASSRK